MAHIAVVPHATISRTASSAIAHILSFVRVCVCVFVFLQWRLFLQKRVVLSTWTQFIAFPPFCQLLELYFFLFFFCCLNLTYHGCIFGKADNNKNHRYEKGKWAYLLILWNARMANRHGGKRKTKFFFSFSFTWKKTLQNKDRHSFFFCVFVCVLFLL